MLPGDPINVPHAESLDFWRTQPAVKRVEQEAKAVDEIFSASVGPS